MESEVRKAMDEIANLNLSDSARLRSLRRVLSMSTFSISKSGGIETFFAEFGALLANRFLTEELFAFSAKLFSSEDSALVQRIFCALIDASEAVPLGFRLKYYSLVLQMLRVCPTFWKRCPTQNTAPMIDSTMKLLGRSKDLGSLSEDNVLAVLAAMDPHANWIRTWMHRTSYRQFMREGMEPILRRISTFLMSNTVSSEQTIHFAGFYSTHELATMLTINYGTIALIALQYPDLFAPYPALSQEVLEACATVIRRNFRLDRGSHVSKALATILTDISCVQTAAEVLRTILPTLINLRSVVNVRIVLNVLQFSDLPLDESILKQLIPMVNRYLNFKQTVVRNDVIRILDLALDKCSSANVNSLLSKDLLLRQLELSNSIHCSVLFRLGLRSSIPLAELLDSPMLWRLKAPLGPLSMTEHRIFARLLCTWLLDSSDPFPSPNIIVLLCQPFTIVDVLNSSDFASFFDLHFEEISQSRGASFLKKLTLLAANVDFSTELRRSYSIISRVFQICSNKCHAFYDEATEVSLHLLVSIAIGSTTEKKVPDWRELPRKPSDVVAALYQTLEERASRSEFDNEQFYSNPLDYLLALWKEGGIPHKEVLEAMATVFRQSLPEDLPEEEPDGFHPCGQEWTPLLDYAQYRLGLLSGNRRAIRRIGQSLLVPYAPDDTGRTDWILGILFILAKFDRPRTNDLSRLLAVNPSVSTLWPSFHHPVVFCENVQSRVLPLVEEIINSTEFEIIKHCLLAGRVPIGHLLAFFLNQGYLNVLEWEGVADYVVLSLIGGAKFQAIHFCAVLYSLKNDLLRLVNGGDLRSYVIRPKVDTSQLSNSYELVLKVSEKNPSLQREI